jgi:HK97 family phage major capsid protein
MRNLMDEHDGDLTPEAFSAMIAKVTETANEVSRLTEAAKADRSASKARMIGTMRGPSNYCEPGRFLSSIVSARGNDYAAQIEGKAYLDSISRFSEPTGKATLGTSDATGGWIIPNAIVDDLVKPAPSARGLIDIVNRKPGFGNQYQIDIPLRLASPNRAVIASWGSLKENVDLVYNGYTATMYTLARIHDISNQLLRKSAGAAEADALGELREAIRLGESYYLWSGTGTGMPYGLAAAFTGAPAGFTSAFTPAATLAGSTVAAIGTALGALAARGITDGLAAVLSPTSFTRLVVQGADQAGVYLSGVQGYAPVAGFGSAPIVYGVPVIADPLCGDDDLYVGDWSKLNLYVGDSMRIDTSSVAGTRWDYNVTGFRIESEMGLDARPFVYAGWCQFIADIAP